MRPEEAAISLMRCAGSKIEIRYDPYKINAGGSSNSQHTFHMRTVQCGCREYFKENWTDSTVYVRLNFNCESIRGPIAHCVHQSRL